MAHHSGGGTGLLTIWCRHTSASLFVQENASLDLGMALKKKVEKPAALGLC